MSWFGSKKGPQELIKAAEKRLHLLIHDKPEGKELVRCLEKLEMVLVQMKEMLYGDDIAEADPLKAEKLCPLMFSSDILHQMLRTSDLLSFEARKCVQQIWCYILCHQSDKAVKYVAKTHPDVLWILIQGYQVHDLYPHYGPILKECISFEPLWRTIVSDSRMLDVFFELAQVPSFEVAADALSIIRHLFVPNCNRVAAGEFMVQHLDEVGVRLNTLFLSKNFATQRQSLKLLADIFADKSKHYFAFMQKYIACSSNLCTIMNLMRSHHHTVQVAAFHVFGVFVANPDKSPAISGILMRNKTRILHLVDMLQVEDAQLNHERGLVREVLSTETLPAQVLSTEPLAAQAAH